LFLIFFADINAQILKILFNFMNNKSLLFLVFSLLVLFVHNEDYKSFIAKLNLDLEEVQVTTEDRYINTLWVLTSKDKQKKNGQSIIFQHGLLDGGFTWLILGEDSLPKKLCEQGYTVYISYIRGTQFSRSHLDHDSGLLSDYWNFSFDEMAQYDLPAMINLIKEREHVEKVIYIGHSQGTLIYFLAYMNNPDFIEKNIQKFIALGTVPNVNNAPHFLIKLFQLSNILSFIPVKNFLTFPKEFGQVAVPLCTSKAKVLCNKILSISFGGLKDTGRINYDRLGSTIFLYEPGGTSLQNMKHWIQIATAKKLQKYDYGSIIENMKHYNQITPPAYDLNKMKKYSVPSLMTTSDADPFANPKDTLEFVDLIENKNIVEILSLTNYNHLDYFWADSAIEEIFPKVLSFVHK
jgi:pimeloyl-ACP methyl ester carboxylesterase